MKRLLYILICFLYLVSSVGYASIEHYCHALHERSSHSGHCGCAVSYHGETESANAQAPSHCCAGGNDAEKTEKAVEVLRAGQCCENINSYHQIDEPTTRESNPDEVSISNEPSILLSPDPLNWFSFLQPLNLPADPSFQLNLPLLN